MTLRKELFKKKVSKRALRIGKNNCGDKFMLCLPLCLGIIVERLCHGGHRAVPPPHRHAPRRAPCQVSDGEDALSITVQYRNEMSLRTMAGDGRARPGRRAAQEMTPGAGARLIDEGLDAVQARAVMATPRTAGAGRRHARSCILLL